MAGVPQTFATPPSGADTTGIMMAGPWSLTGTHGLAIEPIKLCTAPSDLPPPLSDWWLGAASCW